MEIRELTKYIDNVLCIRANILWKKDLMSRSYYYDLTSGQNVIKVIRRSAPNHPAMIAYDSIPYTYRLRIEELLGDPRKEASKIRLSDYLRHDQNAKNYFDDYTYGEGIRLSEKSKNKYLAQVMVLNAIAEILETRIYKRRGVGKGIDPWPNIAKAVHQLNADALPHSLPQNPVSLRRKYERYHRKDMNNYKSLVHKNHGNTNPEKVNDTAKLWLINRWADQVNKVPGIYELWQEYNSQSKEQGWKNLETEETIRNFLFKEDIQSYWYGHRYGTLKAKEKYTVHHTTKLPTMRDSLWYSDGTKLNMYYQDSRGKMCSTNVYEVMDAYSEVFLGSHISDKEDYEAQYMAYKAAARFSGYRPYQITYDNQGGHKKLGSTSFLSQLSQLSIATQPYNGKSKTIEQAFGRFQMKYLKKHWFFTGQNITATAEESKARMEFILANQKNLPTLEEIKAIYYQERQLWNEAPRLQGETDRRIDLYLNSTNPETSQLSVLDMVDLFWITRTKPVAYKSGGLSFTEKGSTYEYLVYQSSGVLDAKFHRDNQDKKFIVRFDPDDMTLIYLYEQTPLGMRLVTAAETKIEIARGRQEITPEQEAFRVQVQAVNKATRIEMRDRMVAIQEQFGTRPEDYGLNSTALKGIENRRSQKSKAKVEIIKPKTDESDDIAGYNKLLSNMTADMDDEMDLYNSY